MLLLLFLNLRDFQTRRKQQCICSRLGDRYQNTTFNGLPLPSNDVNKKNIDLDLFSTDIIENVSVGKAYSQVFMEILEQGMLTLILKSIEETDTLLLI